MRRARVTLPARAGAPLHVEDESSGLALDATMLHADDVAGEPVDGYVAYRGALGEGSTVVHRPTWEGTEDVVSLRDPGSSELRYDLALGPRVAGLRLVSRTLELLDAAGAPRLRVAPPWLVDSIGVARDADLTVEGCAVDTNPAAPWGRKPVAPGPRRCTVRVSWNADGLTYPVAIDPTWSTTGSLATARRDHTLTALAGDQVLATGGYTAVASNSTSCELYDPTTAAWAATGSLSLGRRSHTATLLTAFDSVMVTGGNASGNGTTSTEMYVPATGLWTTPSGSTLVQGRMYHTATAVSGRQVLVVGGFGYVGPSYSTIARAELFTATSAAAGSFASGGILSDAREYHTAAMISSAGAVLVAGGTYYFNPNDGGATTSNEFASAETWDPSTNKWTTVGSLRWARSGHTMAVLSTSPALAIGGSNATSGYLSSVESFDTRALTWTTVGSMNATRSNFAAVTMLDGRVLAVGGSSNPGTSEVYDPVADKWTAAGTLGTPRYGHPLVLLSKGWALTAGGYAASTATQTPSAELFSFLGQGASCTSWGQCDSGFCIDGVCCNSACGLGSTTDCQACSAAGGGAAADGLCGPLTALAASAVTCRSAAGACDVSEKCSATSTACPGDTFATSTAICRAIANECDVAETCTGTSATCPNDAVQPAGKSCSDDGNWCTTDLCNGTAGAAVCVHAAGNAGLACSNVFNECDLVDVCDGISVLCPSTAMKPAGTACTDDGNVCTLDVCSGPGAWAGPTCTHPAGNAGQTCRAAASECDLAETCTGTTAACPTDAVKGNTVACTDDGNACTTDLCNGLATSPACVHAAGNGGTVCRAAAGLCDAPDLCTGTSSACPADAKRPTSYVCRAAVPPTGTDTTTCDADEKCDGTNDNCPADAFKTATTSCRAASCTSAVATLAASCTGSSAACPSTQTQSCAPSSCNGTVCGGCTGDAQCAGTQYCSSGVCTAKKANGQTCSAGNECTNTFCVDGVCCNTACAAGTCDSCVNTGSVGTCSAVPAVTVCRPAAGECDTAETCGGSMSCPSDAKKPNSASCTDDGNVCTRDVCDGASNACTHPAGNAGTLCRAANGTACDVADSCDGNSTTCTDSKAAAGTACRGAAGECDLAESCDGASDACPTDAKKSVGTACADDGNVCTTDACDGSSASCQHPAGNAGTTCRAQSGPCDVADTCSGTSTVCTDGKRSASFVCRTSTGECDPGESCDGASNACPADLKRSNGTSCADDANPCTTDLCDGSSATCQHNAGFAGVQCRASAGACDVADACTGTSTVCPDNKQAAGTACRNSGGVCDVVESCDGATNDCPADAFANPSVSCRSASCSTAVATLAATCSGTAASCPTAQTQSCAPSTCNASNTACGGCSDDSQCTGAQFCSGGVCVTKKAAGATCGGANECSAGFCADGVCCNTACGGGVCDACNLAGSVGTCAPTASSTVCRAAASECDVAETCGGAMACPSDATKDGQACSTDGNVCTTDVCQGTVCAHPAAAANTPCRAAARECDVAETCGGATSCPADGFTQDGTSCTDDGNTCTSDVCQAGSCAHPAGHAGTVCRAAAGECDVDDKCDGVAASCPADGHVAEGTACSGDGNVCTVDACAAGLCAHTPGNAGTVCRPAVGECDLDESCSGASPSCPNDGFRANGASCTDDGQDCTFDQCQGGLCAHPAGHAGTVCRPATGECDVDEKCDGASTSCPTDAFQSEGSACTNDGNDCTLDKCAQGKCAHPSADGVACNDGNVCSSPDLCATGQCVGTPIAGCTCGTDADCNDSNVCNGTETCNGGVCKPGTALACDDHNACTDDGCNGSLGCTHASVADGAACDDGAYCTNDDMCAAGICLGATPHDCSGAASDACHVGVCDEATDACVAQAVTNNTACDDGDACTLLDKCNSGACVGQQKLNCHTCATVGDCDDSNPCTTDLCDDVSKQCAYVAISGCSFDAGVPDSGSDAATDAPAEAGPDAGLDAAADGDAAASDAPTDSPAEVAADADVDAADAGGGGASNDAGPGFAREQPGWSCSTSGPPAGGSGAPLAWGLMGLAWAVQARRSKRVRSLDARPAAALLAIVLASGLSAQPAWAQSDDERSGARAAATEGAKALAEGRLAQAADLFTRAESLVHAPPHLLYLARAYVGLGKLVAAQETYRRLVKEELAANAPKAFVKAQEDGGVELATLGARVPSLRIDVRGAPLPKLVVTMDGAVVPAALLGLPRPVDPGAHRLSATATGLASEPVTVDVREGAKEQIELVLAAAAEAAILAPPSIAGAGDSSPPKRDSAPAPADEHRTMRTAGYVTLGVGGVALCAAGIFALESHTKRLQGDDLCPGGRCPASSAAELDDLDAKAASFGKLAVLSGALGVAGVATGVTLLVLGKKPAATHASLTPWVGPTSLGVIGSF